MKCQRVENQCSISWPWMSDEAQCFAHKLISYKSRKITRSSNLLIALQKIEAWWKANCHYPLDRSNGILWITEWSRFKLIKFGHSKPIYLCIMQSFDFGQKNYVFYGEIKVVIHSFHPAVINLLSVFITSPPNVEPLLYLFLFYEFFYMNSSHLFFQLRRASIYTTEQWSWKHVEHIGGARTKTKSWKAIHGIDLRFDFWRFVYFL